MILRCFPPDGFGGVREGREGINEILVFSENVAIS
jgi:hypothetical protein